VKALFLKELNLFFSNITGYLVIIIFLITNSLFLWIFPGNYNVLESGYANLDTFFFIAPWVFLFLVPAITMRSIADERKAGTLEILFTKPLTNLQIVLAKYLASLALVLFSLLPTLLWFWSVWMLGNPPGSIDTGGTWGSYIGLFFLAAIYVAIGIFASSLTDNQVIAFIIAVLFSFFIYIGFDAISGLAVFSGLQTEIMALGISAHYNSMSRGVIDIADVAYFLSTIALFILFTKHMVQRLKV